MLFLADVDRHILAFRRFPDNHAFVNLHARSHKQHAAILGVIQAVATGFAGFKHHEGSLYPLRNIHAVHDAVAVGIGQKLLPVAHQAARRDAEFQMAHAGVTGAHVDDLRLAGSQLFHNRAHILLGHLDHQQFHRLEGLAVFILLINDPRAADRKLKSLPAHGFNQDGQMQLTAARHLECVGCLGFAHPHTDVGFNLFKQTVPQVAGGHELSLTSGKRAVIDHENH